MKHSTWKTVWGVIRDVAFAVSGLYGFFHELNSTGEPRDQLLILCAAMMGLPAVIRAEDPRKKNGGETDEQQPSAPARSPQHRK